MINEVTINSNNAIELSRGELLNWVNELLKTNLAKIQHLGTGAVYCQLTDVLYPGKIPMSKVNWKAKFDYQFVSNFKILQQTFTNLKIRKHIEVEKLIKCKYQDNLEFLQWFRKNFESHGASKEYNPIARRGEAEAERKKEKENKANHSTSRDVGRSNSRTHTQHHDRSQVVCDSFLASEKNDEHDRSIPSFESKPLVSANPPNSPQPNFKAIDIDWKQQVKEQAFLQEREFYLKKFKQIEHLCEDWNQQRHSGELIDQIRRIILVAPNVSWSVENGEYQEMTPSSTSIVEAVEGNS